MRAIYKYKLESVNVITTLELPIGAKFRFAWEQKGKICLWMEINTKRDTWPRKFIACATGELIPTGARYRGSVFTDLQEVYHVYEMVVE